MARNNFAEGRGISRTRVVERAPEAPLAPPEERAVRLLSSSARDRIAESPENLAKIREGFNKFLKKKGKKPV